MASDLEAARSRLQRGRLLLQQHKTHTVPLHPQLHLKGDPAEQSKKLIKTMDLAIADMEKYLASLRKSPHP